MPLIDRRDPEEQCTIPKEMGDQWRFDAAGWSCHRGKILYNLFVSYGRFPKPSVHGPLDTETWQLPIR
jgi:hypothetical protein